MIYHLFANRTNIGDWLSARGIQSLLGNPPLTELLADEPFVADSLARLAAAGADDILIIGGGGLLMDYFDPLWTGLSRLPHLPRTYAWGIGVVDIKHTRSLPNRRSVLRVLRASRMCFVRDELTRDFLDMPSIGDPAACPSICALEASPRDQLGILHVANMTTVGDAAYRRMRRAAMRFARLNEMPFRETNNRLDRSTTDELQRKVDLYRMSDRVVSSALHGCVIATAVGRPVAAVSGDAKIDAFMTAAGLGDWLLPADGVVALPQLIGNLGDQPRVTDFIDRTIAANKAIARRVMADMGSASLGIVA